MIFCFKHRWFEMPRWDRSSKDRRVCLKCGKLQHYEPVFGDCPIPEAAWVTKRKMKLPEVMQLVLTHQ